MLPKVIKNEMDIDEAMKNLLLDDFSVYGDDAALFAKTQKRISDNTYTVTIPMSYIRILSVLPEENQPKDGRLAVYVIDAGGINEIFLDLNLGAKNNAGLWNREDGKERENSTKPAADPAKVMRTALGRMMARTIPEISFYPVVNGQKADNKEVVEELKRTRLLFQAAGKTYIISQFALPTLGQRIELKGKALQEPCLERDIFIAKRLQSKKNIQFVIKAANGLGKVFMAASDVYKPLPMTVIEQIYHEFGAEDGLGKKMRCEGWEIDHSMSRIRFSFLDYGKASEMAFLYGLDENEAAIPGVEIISSDIGDYAFTIRGFWKVKRGYLYSDEVSRKHTGEIDVEEIIDEVRHTIFERYTLLPERFMELLETDITPDSVREAAEALKRARQAVPDTGATGIMPDDAVGSTADDDTAARAREALERAEKRANRQFRDHSKLLDGIVKKIMKVITTSSLQYKKDWTERVVEDLDPAVSYTAYDIMSLILDTQIMTRSDNTAEKMRKSMMKLPYLDYARYRDDVIDKLTLFRTRNKENSDEAEENAANQLCLLPA